MSEVISVEGKEFVSNFFGEDDKRTDEERGIVAEAEYVEPSVETVVGESVDIPPMARQEILRLYKEMDDNYRNFMIAKTAFFSFVFAVKEELGVPTDEPWDISDDASKFLKAEGTGNLPTDSIVVQECDDKGDVTGV